MHLRAIKCCLLMVLSAHRRSTVVAAKHKGWHWNINVTPYSSLDLPCIAMPGPLTKANGSTCTSWGSDAADYTFSSYEYVWTPHWNRGHSEEPWSYGHCNITTFSERDCQGAIASRQFNANILARYSSHCEPYLLDEHECPGVARSMYISCPPFVSAHDIDNPPVLKETAYGEIRKSHNDDALVIAKGKGRDCRKV